MNESNLVDSGMTNSTNATLLNVTDLIRELVGEKKSTNEDLPPLVSYTLILVGIIGNALVCLAILLDKKLQNLSNYFLFSLAVTDLLVSIVIIPGRIATRQRLKPRYFPLCFLYLIGDDYITAASAIHICFISLERYFAISNPFKQMQLSKRRVAVKISLVWIIAFLTIIPYITTTLITKHSNRDKFCGQLLSKFKFFNLLLFIEAMVIVVMIVVVVVSFVMTTRVLHKMTKKQNENMQNTGSGLVKNVGGVKSKNPNNNNLKISQNERKALRVIWIVSFAFVISMGPYACTSLFHLAFPYIKIPGVIYDVTAYMSYANSVVNPIIYTIFNKTFRNDFKNLLLLKYKLE